MTGIDKSGSVVKHVSENSFFDELLQLSVPFLGNFVGILDSRTELEVVLKE
jgi:hypothetical protein